MLTFTSSNSKFDKVMRGDEGIVFSEFEQKGYELFKTNCASCHKEPLFTSDSFENNGLSVDTMLNDYGRLNITGKSSDSLKFRVPTLRNIEVSYPYMHDGRYRNLQMVLFHYTNNVHDSSTLNPKLKGGLELSEIDKRNLIAFLKTLTDVSFLRNQDFTFPR
jgi:cytochrome c peroxidase